MSVNVHLGDEQGLDRTRRYLRPVARLPLPDQPDDTHLAVYSWLPQFEAWATGPAICGYSTSQGPLPEGAAVTCEGCLDRQASYDRMLTPGRIPGSDVPVTRQELRDTLEEIIRGHSRLDSTDWDINLAMSAVDAHIAYLAEQAQGACPCALGSPEMYEGPLRDCPIHGERGTEGER